MATETTKLQLLKPAAADRVDVSAHVSDNFQTLDTRINAFVCTSGTHPSSPYTGMLILESDTANILVWGGSDWKIIGNDSWGKGFKASTSITADTANTSGTTELDTGIQVTFSAESDRKYMVELSCIGNFVTDAGTAGGELFFKYRWASGAAVGTSDTELGSSDSATFVGGTHQRQYQGWRIWTPAVTGNVTVGVFLVGAASEVYRISGNATSNRGHMTVTDVGAA